MARLPVNSRAEDLLLRRRASVPLTRVLLYPKQSWGKAWRTACLVRYNTHRFSSLGSGVGRALWVRFSDDWGTGPQSDYSKDDL